MTDLELVMELYKPYRVTKMSKCTIIDSMDGKFVIKEKVDKDIKGLFSYLKSRNFNNFPKLIDDTRSNINIYSYIEDTKYPIDQKASDMIKLIVRLHSSTSYTKEVREDKYKEIYENIKGNLMYYLDENKNYATIFEKEEFMSPSQYLFMRNYSKIINQIKFCQDKLDLWYESVKDKRKIRVCTIHNNLKLEHFIKGESEALISWEKSTIDSPVLDIYTLYKNEALNIEFGTLLDYYINNLPLEDEEKELLLILICLPNRFEFEGTNELDRCSNVAKNIELMLKSERLARPYYSVDS